VWEDARVVGARIEGNARAGQGEGLAAVTVLTGTYFLFGEGLGNLHLFLPLLGLVILFLVTFLAIKEWARVRARREREQLADVLSHLTEGLVLLDLNGRITFANQAAARITGFTVAELSSLTWDAERWPLRITDADGQEIVPSDGFKVWADPTRQPLLGAKRILTRRDGSRVILRVNVVPHRGLGGQVSLVITFTDVTQREEAEAEQARLQRERDESLSRFQLLLERMPIGCVLTDADFKITYLNPAAERLFGFTLPEAQNQSPFELFIPPEASPYVEAIRERMKAGDMAAHALNANRTKDGRTIVCEWHNTPLRNSDGQTIGYLGMVQDVTVRTESEDALRESEARYRLLAENASDMITRMSVEGICLYASPACRTLFGWEPEELVGRSGYDFFHPEDVPRIREDHAALLREKETITVTHRSRHKDGGYVWLESIVRSIRDPQSGAIREFIAVSRDVSARRELEAQLRQAQKMEAVGQLAGGIAHDFNNVLTIIIGYVSLIQESLGRASPWHGPLQEVHKAADRAASLTRQLLAFSRKQVLQPVVLDLNAVVARVEIMLGRLLGEDVRLVVALDPTLRRVKADPGQVEQVLMNLAVNARDAMPQGGQLTITTANVTVPDDPDRERPEMPPGPYAALTVRDTGCGMPPEVLAKIFEPFFTTKEVGKGTGLGLSTVYGIVKQSGGFVYAESTEGVGSIFVVYLPATEATPEAPVEPSSPGIRVRPTVLLVEDEDGVRAFAREVLCQTGYEVLEAAGGPEALELSRRYSGPIDLLVTDVVMPDMRGPELSERLHQERPETRVLFLSGYAEPELRHQEGFDRTAAFLTKPFTPTALSRTVREVLGSRQ
jgi:PAS domain S-box-containing protein